MGLLLIVDINLTRKFRYIDLRHATPYLGSVSSILEPLSLYGHFSIGGYNQDSTSFLMLNSIAIGKTLSICFNLTAHPGISLRRRAPMTSRR